VYATCATIVTYRLHSSPILCPIISSAFDWSLSPIIRDKTADKPKKGNISRLWEGRKVTLDILHCVFNGLIGVQRVEFWQQVVPESDSFFRQRFHPHQLVLQIEVVAFHRRKPAPSNTVAVSIWRRVPEFLNLLKTRLY